MLSSVERLHDHLMGCQVQQGSSAGRVAGSLVDYVAGVVGTELVFLVKPYHEVFPNYTDASLLGKLLFK